MKLSKLYVSSVESKISNIVIIIGSNNSGKTKLLQSLFDQLTGIVEVGSTEYTSEQTRTPYWSGMVKAGYFEYKTTELDQWVKAQKKWRTTTGYPGIMMYHSTDYILQVKRGEDASLPEDAYEDLRANVRTNPPTTELKWILPFKKSHIQELGVEQRFDEANQMINMNLQGGDESNYLQYTNKSTLDEINKHLVKLFDKKIVPLMNSLNTYTMLVVKKEDFALVPKWARTNYPSSILKTSAEHSAYTIDHPEYNLAEQSHGTRAAVTLLSALSDNKRKISFIDEPELHLYPAARKYMASFIAGSTEGAGKQVIMVTHDPLIVDGIAASNKNFTIIKVGRDRSLSVVDFDERERRRTASELKNTQSIQAGFYDAALFVEGMDDKFVYQMVIGKKKLIPEDFEFGVIETNGGDRMKDSIKFALDIKTKVAAIIDFDQLTSYKKVKNTTLKQPYVELLMTAMDLPAELIQEAVDICVNLNIQKWINGKNINEITDGVLKARVQKFINNSKKYGVFIVPVGEAYDWFGKSKSFGPVEDLRSMYFYNSRKFPELTEFMKEVCSYLTVR